MRLCFVLSQSIPRRLPRLTGRRRLNVKYRGFFQIVLHGGKPALAIKPNMLIRGGEVRTPKPLAVFASGIHQYPLSSCRSSIEKRNFNG